MPSIAMPLSRHPVCPANFRLSELCPGGSCRDFIKWDGLHITDHFYSSPFRPHPESVQNLLRVTFLEQKILARWTFK